MICVIAPVYQEPIALLTSTIKHLLGFEKVSQVIIAAADSDRTLVDIERLVGEDFGHVKRLQLVISDRAGRAHQMNAGAQQATCQRLLFIHADTRLPDRADQLITQALSKRPWGRFDLALDDPSMIYKTIGWWVNKRSRLTGINTGDQAIFMTRELYQQAGGFPGQALMEDVEFSKRAKKIAAPVCITNPVITSARRWQKNGVIKTILLMWWLRGLYWFGVSPERLAQVYRHVR